MGKKSQKLLVYLDQNFLSDMAKADFREKVRPEFKGISGPAPPRRIYRRKARGACLHALHDIESSLGYALERPSCVPMSTT